MLRHITLRGSIAGTRHDLAEAIAVATEGRVKARIHCRVLADINSVFDEREAGTADGRIAIAVAA